MEYVPQLRLFNGDRCCQKSAERAKQYGVIDRTSTQVQGAVGATGRIVFSCCGCPQTLDFLTQDLTFFRDGAGIAHAPQPLRRILAVKARDGRDHLLCVVALRPSPTFSRAVYSEVCGPNYKMLGDSPRTPGGRVLFGRSFVSFHLGGPLGLGGEAPRFQASAWVLTALARIRGGTQGIANLKGCSFNCSPWGRVSGLGRGRFFVRTAARA